MSSIAICNLTAVTMDPQLKVQKNATILLEDQEIRDIGSNVDIPQGTDRFSAEGKVAIPGLINSHAHAAMALLRGYSDDLPLYEWLTQKIWPLEAKLTPHDVYVGAKLAAAEALLSGTTLLLSAYFYSGEEARAFTELGLKGILGDTAFNFNRKHDPEESRKLAKDWHGKDDLITTCIVPHAPYSVDSEFFQELRELTDELHHRYGTPDSPVFMHFHAAETASELELTRKQFGSSNRYIRGSKSVFDYLNRLEVLAPCDQPMSDVLAAHCVHLNKFDFKILAERGVRVAHCPISNCKLGSGFSPVAELKNQGTIVGLGTDSPCANNTLNLIETIRLTSLLHKGVVLDATVLSAQDVLKMATIEGAKAVFRKNIGSLKPGNKADIVLLDFRRPHLQPCYDEISHIAYSLKSSDVTDVFVNGEQVVQNRQLTRGNLTKILEAAQMAKKSLLARINGKE